MRSIVLIPALGALLACPTGTIAQGLAGGISAVSAGGPMSTIGNLIGGAQLQAAKSSSSASFKLSRAQSFSGATDVAEFNTWALTASAPLNKNSDDTSVTNLDGLANGASVELAFVRFTAQGKRQASVVRSKVGELDSVCNRVYEARKAKDGTEVPQKVEGCGSDLVALYGSDEDKHSFESTFWDLGTSNRWLWGGSAKLGYQDFEYITLTDSSKQKRNETPWSVGVWGAVQPGDRPVLLSASAQYQQSYKEGNASAVCPAPAPTVASVACLTGALDPPKQITKKLVTLEVRARPAGIGVAFSVTRDFESKITGVELPIYFVADKDGKLTAGVKAGWRSDTRGGSITLFVGTPFGLYK